MVYPDPSFSEHTSTPVTAQLAPVTDRLLAFLIDFLLFSPLIGLFLAGQLKDMRTLLIVDPDSSEAGVIWLLFLAAVFGLSVLFEALCVSLFRGTPGQRFLQMEVCSFPQRERIDFMQALTRTLLWWMSIPLVIPLLAVYTHPLRRALHDRGSDTLVISRAGRGDNGPLPVERDFFRSWGRFAFLFVLFVLTMSALRVRDLLADGHFTRERMSEAGLLCPDLPSDLSGARRLDRAVASFLAGQADRDCLDREADLALWGALDGNRAFAYLAKGLATEDTEVSSTYLTKSCETDKESEACALSQFVASTDQDRSSFLRRKGLESLSSRVLLLRENVDRGELASAAALIRDLRAEKGFNDYVNREEVRTLWKIRDKSRGREPASSELREVQRDFEERYELR